MCAEGPAARLRLVTAFALHLLRPGPAGRVFRDRPIPPSGAVVHLRVSLADPRSFPLPFLPFFVITSREVDVGVHWCRVSKGLLRLMTSDAARLSLVSLKRIGKLSSVPVHEVHCFGPEWNEEGLKKGVGFNLKYGVLYFSRFGRDYGGVCPPTGSRGQYFFIS